MSDLNIIRSNRRPLETPLISVGEYIWNELAKLNGDAISIIEGNTDRELTVKELMTKSNSIAMALIERGINKSDIIMTLAENSIELVIALIASLLLGVTIYPVSPIANIYEMQTLLETLGSLTIFSSKTKTKIIAEVVNRSKANEKQRINIKNIIVLDGVYDNYSSFEDLLKEGLNKKLNRIPYFDVNPKKDIFGMLQSSGTSGIPKSVMIAHFAFVQSLQTFADIKRVENPIYSHITPFGCISGITILLSSISVGTPTIIYRDFNEQLILKTIEKYRVNTMMTTPTFVHKLIDEENCRKYDLSSLKFVNTAGAAIEANAVRTLINKYDLKFCEGYGMTEFGTLTSFLDSEPDDPEYIPGNLGRPAPNSEIKVIDINTGQSLGPNIDGEICVKGEKLFSGYLNNKSATDEAIDREGWFHTGDVGHYDEEHRVYITDRLKELIKYGTKQVSPTELEQFLLTHESVAEVAVVGVKHKTDTQWPRAYIKTKPGANVTEDELKKFVSDNLNIAKQLRAGVVFLDRIPRTTIGKVDRRYFKQLVANELIED